MFRAGSHQLTVDSLLLAELFVILIGCEKSPIPGAVAFLHEVKMTGMFTSSLISANLLPGGELNRKHFLLPTDNCQLPTKFKQLYPYH
jgi:hypothetical protein